MSKTKKIIITIIIGLMATLLINTNVKACSYSSECEYELSTRPKSSGNGVDSQYTASHEAFCAQHSPSNLPYGDYHFKTIGYVDIYENDMIFNKGLPNQAIFNNNYLNAKMGYVANAPYDFASGQAKSSSQKANALWNTLNAWYPSFSGGISVFGEWLYNATGNPGFGTDLESDADIYASTNFEPGGYKPDGTHTNISKGAFQDITDKKALKATPVNNTTIKVGQFKWKFSSGTVLKGIEVLDQRGRPISGISYNSGAGWSTDINTIKSEQPFDIGIKDFSGITMITKIKVKYEYPTGEVHVSFMKNLNGGLANNFQNFILITPQSTQEGNSELEYNIPLVVDLSGYVWVDKEDGKQSARNDLYKNDSYDTNDIKLAGVTVMLKDKSGNIVKSLNGKEYKATTKADGSYKFEDVLIAGLGNYHIEFEYNGLKYTNVTVNLSKPNGSKSSESPNARTAFNNNFATIEGNGRTTGFTRNLSGGRVHDLNYTLGDHISTLINNVNMYPIAANTKNAGYSIKDHFTGQTEIKNINLGLYEREQPDIALINDLENIRLTINGYEHTYKYSQRFINQGKYGDGFNIGIKFGSNYSDMSYTRAIYKSDYEYVNEANRNKELKAYMTYKIALKNQSTNLKTRVNSIVDYFDSRYSIVSVGTALNQNGTTNNNLGRTETGYNSNYKKVVIDTNTIIDPQSTVDNIYIQFELNREAVISILNDKATLNNIAEINTYSVFDRNNQVYAGVDKDSNPGNCVPGDKNTYEDDTDAAPTLKLEVTDAREIAGTVFLDEATGEVGIGKIRQGDGEYKSGEKGINGVTVTLKENTGSGKIYEATTNTSGDFIIPGYIPGDYTLTYTWGDNTYTVQNYKGTVYDSSRNQNNKKWYKENIDVRKTDAIDNYALRLNIDNEMKNITNFTKTTITKMDSATPTMGIGVEYEDTYTASSGDRYTYRINNIDFGIIERARQQLKMTKRVKKAKVTLANGQVIIDVEIDEKGNIIGDRKYFVHLPASPGSNPKNGMVKIELDNEIIQGSVLEVEYEFKAKNNSELDYLSENYYKYGTDKVNLITMTAKEVIDYLDKDWAFDRDKNPDWQVKSLEELKALVSKDVYESENTTINEKLILYTSKLSQVKIKPTKTAEISLKVSKVLTRTDDISLDNETEIIQIERPGGSKPKEIPGNYVPGKGPEEVDSSQAETVIVTPNTGENQNYLIPIGIITTSLIILGAGAIIIKKKTLKKDK